MTAQSAATVPFTLMSNAIRFLAMDAVQAANSGHPGMPMGMADVATVLYSKFLKFDPTAPTWSDRDRFVLSAGHGSMLLYAINHLTGYEAVAIDQIKRFRQLGSITAGHPEVDHEAGIETTTGPLGQGIANAVGMALAERILNARFGDALVDHRTWAIAGDGCMMEGISHEAASLAGHLKLGRLVVLYDDNQISIDGPTSLSFSDDTPKRFEAYGWHVIRAVDGHDPSAIEAALAEAVRVTDRPSLVCCRTVIGKGAPNKCGTDKVHGSPLGVDEVAAARSHLDWSHEPFVVPPEVLDAWRAIGRRCRTEREAWESRLAKVASETRDAFVGAMTGRLPADLPKLFDELKQAAAAEAPKLATRQSSGRVLDALVPAIPELIGGSADLTPSNNTKTPASTDIRPGVYGGRYIRWGVREHGMAAGMNGLALHGGVIPYGATFLTFTDYCRPAIRLSALMHQRVVYVMTHDSIGLGEDGPTHQPVEHLPALRAMPNLLVLRPADLVETIECWQIALEQTRRPSILSLTRQALPAVRKQHHRESLSARGAYVLAEASRDARATIFASGSEVAVALDARTTLEREGVPTRVVSVPSFELFHEQDEEYRAAILDGGGAKVAVEAAMRFGWDAFIGSDGGFVGMNSFGASAPIDDLYRHFGITPDAVIREVRARL